MHEEHRNEAREAAESYIRHLEEARDLQDRKQTIRRKLEEMQSRVRLLETTRVSPIDAVLEDHPTQEQRQAEIEVLRGKISTLENELRYGVPGNRSTILSRANDARQRLIKVHAETLSHELRVAAEGLRGVLREITKLQAASARFDGMDTCHWYVEGVSLGDGLGRFDLHTGKLLGSIDVDPASGPAILRQLVAEALADIDGDDELDIEIEAAE